MSDEEPEEDIEEDEEPEEIEEEEEEEEEEKEEDEGDVEESEMSENDKENKLNQMIEQKHIATYEHVFQHEYEGIIINRAVELSRGKKPYIQTSETDYIKVAFLEFWRNVLPYILHRYVQGGYVAVKLKELRRLPSYSPLEGLKGFKRPDKS